MATNRAGSQRLASWIFGGIAFVFLIGVFIFGPDELSAEKHRILGIMCAVLAGLFGYFFTGSMKLVTEGQLPKWGKVAIQSSGGTALFVLVLLWWGSDYAPVGRLQEKVEEILDDTSEIKEGTSEIKQGVAQIVEMLGKELSIKNEQVTFLQGQVTRLQGITPSDRARQLALQIPEDAGPYALALKAIADQRFDDARRFLDKAQEQKEIELAEIYRTRGQTEYYAGNYIGAASWYEKALDLVPDNAQDEFEINFGLGKTFEILGNKDAAIKKLEKAVHSAGELEKPLVLAQALTHLGISLLHAGKLDKSFEYLEKARKIYDSHKDTLLGEDTNAYILCLNYNGINYRERKKWESAKKCHDLAIEYAERVGNNRLKAHALANIGAISLRQNDFEAVLEKWKQALKIAIDDEDRPWVAHYYIDVGFLNFLLGENSDAMYNLDEGIKIAKKDFYEDNIARGLMNKGSIFFDEGNLDTAESYYSKALGIAEKNSVVRLIWRLEHNIGNIFRKRKKYDEAEKLYLNAIEIIETMLKEYTDHEQKLGFISHRLNAFRSLILLYCQEKRYDDAHTIADRGLDNSLKAFLKRRVDEIALENDDDCIKNKNFKKGFFIETE